MKTDHLHFTGVGQRRLGEDFALRTAYLLWVKDRFPAAQRGGGAAEAAADADLDGADNWSEFIGGTAPRDAASRLAGSLQTNPGGISLWHGSEAGVTYAVEFRPTPGAAWTEVLPAVPGTGSPMERVLAVPGSAGQFRVAARRP